MTPWPWKVLNRDVVSNGTSSSYDSLKTNHFSQSPKSDVIDDATVIRAVACGFICYWDKYDYAIKLNLSFNCTTILYGHQTQPQSFCKPKVKQKISHNCVGISSFHFIAMYSKTDGVTWWIVMVIWWTRYWTQDLVFFSFTLWSYLDIYALYFWCRILYCTLIREMLAL